MPLQFQTVWIQIKSDILLGLIWVQTVCKDYQQMKKLPLAGKEIKPSNFHHCFAERGNFCKQIVTLFSKLLQTDNYFVFITFANR